LAEKKCSFAHCRICFANQNYKLKEPDLGSVSFITLTFSRTVVFSYSYFDNASNPGGNKDYLYKRLKLDGLNEAGVGNYTFTYNTGDLPAKNYTSSDYWGFYNGQNYGDEYYTQAYNGNQLCSGALKTSDEASMLKGTLKKIDYPTGGYCQFTYEINKSVNTGLNYILGSTNASLITDGGGLRIKQIETGGNNVVTKYRNFTYSGGKVIKPLCMTYIKQFLADGACNDCQVNYRLFVQTSSSMIPFSSFSKGNIVGYDDVEESLTMGSKTSFTHYTYYNDMEDDEEEGTSIFPFGSSTIKYFNGLPKEVSYGYRDLSDNINYFTKKTTYEYDNPWIKTIYAFHSELNYMYAFLIDIANSNGIGTTPYCDWVDSPPYGYSYRFEWIKKTSETTITANITAGVTALDGTSGIVSTTSYSDYDSQNSIPKTVSGVTTQKVCFPQDFSDNISTGMVSRHLIGTPVERITINKGKVISGEKVNYKYDSSSDMYVPDIAYVLITPSNTTLTLSNYRDYFEPRLYYEIYDSKGKVLQLRKDSKVITYLWGYNNALPVAKIENATLAEVESALGYNGYLPDLGAGGLSAAQNTALRNNLTNALITTFTYVPLIGVVSQVDPKRMTTYYRYDSFNRLAQVLDNNNNILKDYTYHYYTQPAPQIYYNDLQNRFFTKNDCPVNNTPSAVLYNVPAGSYSSTISQADANQQALNDINANGQNYANAHGSCIPISSGSGTISWYFNPTFQNDADCFKIYVNNALVVNTNSSYAQAAFTVNSGDVIRIEVSIAGVDYTDIGAFLDVARTDNSNIFYDSGYVTFHTEIYQFTWDTTYGDLDIYGGSDFLGVYD